MAPVSEANLKPDPGEKLDRREALKVLAASAATLPILEAGALARDHDHAHPAPAPQKPAPAPPKFFTAAQLATIGAIAEHIIPADERSGGAKEAGVPAFIDLMVSESPEETRQLWREGLEAVDKLSREKFSTAFAGASADQQIALLKDLAEGERRGRTIAERFFRAIKNLTIDGYYTSEIGIQRELQYKGNAYLKEFRGCTHPEHQA